MFLSARRCTWDRVSCRRTCHWSSSPKPACFTRNYRTLPVSREYLRIALHQFSNEQIFTRHAASVVEPRSLANRATCGWHRLVCSNVRACDHVLCVCMRVCVLLRMKSKNRPFAYTQTGRIWFPPMEPSIPEFGNLIS